jgi:hypothetical protein
MTCFFSGNSILVCYQLYNHRRTPAHGYMTTYHGLVQRIRTTNDGLGLMGIRGVTIEFLSIPKMRYRRLFQFATQYILRTFYLFLTRWRG